MVKLSCMPLMQLWTWTVYRRHVGQNLPNKNEITGVVVFKFHRLVTSNPTCLLIMYLIFCFITKIFLIRVNWLESFFLGSSLAPANRLQDFFKNAVAKALCWHTVIWSWILNLVDLTCTVRYEQQYHSFNFYPAFLFNIQSKSMQCCKYYWWCNILIKNYRIEIDNTIVSQFSLERHASKIF